MCLADLSGSELRRRAQGQEARAHGALPFVRHPLYVGEFVSFAGAVMAVLSPYSAFLFVFFVMVQAYRATQEERVIKEAFPEYESYMAQAGGFTPR